MEEKFSIKAIQDIKECLTFNRYYKVAMCGSKEETLSVSLGELFKNLGTQLISA